MLPNEKFALECRERYAEDGLVVDESNGEFAHCPLPRGLGETGYYLLHDDHQWQGLLQSKDLGRKCFWTPYTKRWLMKANFVEGYFELWDIFDEFNKFTEETKKKIKGRTHTEETKKKLSEMNKGKTHTEETKKKLSEINKGRTVTEETKKKLSEINKGRTHTEETKKKLSEMNKGKPRSEATKRKISETAKLRAQLKRTVNRT